MTTVRVFTMAIELYEYRIWTKFRDKKQSVRFIFKVDNLDGTDPYEMARAISFQLNVDTLVLTLFNKMISDRAGITDVICRRVAPFQGPASRLHFPGGGIQGEWLENMAENFVAANIRWTGASGNVSKHNSRIGPIGNGALTNNGYYIVFRVAFLTFASEIIAPKMTTSGDPFQFVLRNRFGIVDDCVAGELRWPAARQIQRRWRA